MQHAKLTAPAVDDNAGPPKAEQLADFAMVTTSNGSAVERPDRAAASTEPMAASALADPAEQLQAPPAPGHGAGGPDMEREAVTPEEPVQAVHLPAPKQVATSEVPVQASPVPPEQAATIDQVLTPMIVAPAQQSIAATDQEAPAEVLEAPSREDSPSDEIGTPRGQASTPQKGSMPSVQPQGVDSAVTPTVSGPARAAPEQQACINLAYLCSMCCCSAPYPPQSQRNPVLSHDGLI